MSMQSAAIVLDRLTFAHPGDDPVLASISAAFGRGRTGLIGANGTGKTTLFRLIAGELAPTSGTLTVQSGAAVGYLPQNLTLRTDAQVADLLGIRAVLDGIEAIESGDADPRHFDAVGDAWDAGERALARLAAVVGTLGEPGDLRRPVATLSGGETILAALVGLELARTPVVLLDEPTNNLDADARARLYALVDGWSGTLVIASHDVELLDRLDATAELRRGDLRVFGGPYAAYREALAIEQDAARQAVRTAEQRVRAEHRQRVEAQTKQARSTRQGKAQRQKGDVKVVLDFRQNRAEKSQASDRATHAAREAEARSALADAEASVRDEDRLSLTLPDPQVGSGRRLAELIGADRTVVLAGPERVALVGPNGVGKTTLLRSLVEGEPSHLPASGRALTDRVGYLPQRLDGLADARTPLEELTARAPRVPDRDLRNALASFGLPGPLATRSIGALSGGERFRVALAGLLLADPANQLLVLDEPTNNLDLDTVEALVGALDAYRGGLLVVIHDAAFLRRLRLTRVLALDAEGGLTDRDEP